MISHGSSGAGAFFAKFGKMPNFVQAGAYSAVTNYLKAVQSVKSDDPAAVMKQLKAPDRIKEKWEPRRSANRQGRPPLSVTHSLSG
jgi:hypothetical protein